MSFIMYAAGTGCDDFKRKNNIGQLLSQANERRTIDNWVAYLKEHPECKSNLFIDSGAFSAWTKGISIDVDEYIDYINSIDEYVHCFAQVDKIPGRPGVDPTSEEAAEAPELSWKNYLYMVDKVKSPKKLIPVFHMGEDFKWLKNMLNYKYEDGTYIDYIGLSPNDSFSHTTWIPWFKECFKIITTSDNPNVKTHAFGCTSRKILDNFPFTSSDSTSWLKFAAYGNILYHGKAIGVSNRIDERDRKHFENLTIDAKNEILNKLDDLGLTYEDIQTSDSARKTYNLSDIQDYLANYKCLYTNVLKNQLW